MTAISQCPIQIRKTQNDFGWFAHNSCWFTTIRVRSENEQSDCRRMFPAVEAEAVDSLILLCVPPSAVFKFPEPVHSSSLANVFGSINETSLFNRLPEAQHFVFHKFSFFFCPHRVWHGLVFKCSQSEAGIYQTHGFWPQELMYPSQKCGNWQEVTTGETLRWNN